MAKLKKVLAAILAICLIPGVLPSVASAVDEHAYQVISKGDWSGGKAAPKYYDAGGRLVAGIKALAPGCKAVVSVAKTIEQKRIDGVLVENEFTITLEVKTLTQSGGVQSKALNVYDPMGEYIELAAELPEGGAANLVDNADGAELVWDLTKETPVEKDCVLSYRLTYDIVLKTEHRSFPWQANKIATNKETYLDYYMVDSGGMPVDGVHRKACMTSPVVKGLYACFILKKTIGADEKSAVLLPPDKTAGFTIYRWDGSQWSEWTQAETQSGRIKFDYLPMGQYKMLETLAPSGAAASDTVYYFDVSKGGIARSTAPREQGENTTELAVVNGCVTIFNREKPAEAALVKTVNGAKSAEISPLGETVEYKITVTNTGSIDLKSIMVTDAFENGFTTAGSEYKSFLIKKGDRLLGAVDYSIDTGRANGIVIEFSNDITLAPGEQITIEYQITFAVNAGAVRAMDNRADMTATAEGGEVSANDSAAARQPGMEYEFTVEKGVYSVNGALREQIIAQGDVTKYDAANGRLIVADNDEVVYSVLIRNTGGAPISITGISDSMSGTAKDFSGPYSDSECKSPLTFNAENPIFLGAGASVTVYYRYIVSAEEIAAVRADGGIIKNTAIVSSAEAGDRHDDEEVGTMPPDAPLASATLEKHVAIGSYDKNTAFGAVWKPHDSVIITAGASAAITYRIVFRVQNFPAGAACAVSLADIINGQQVVGLLQGIDAGMYEARGGVSVSGENLAVTGDGEIAIYFTIMRGAGSYENIVTASITGGVDFERAELSASATAEVTERGGPTEPTAPGETTEPVDPGATEPAEPTEPSRPRPTEPGTAQPGNPGTQPSTEPDSTQSGEEGEADSDMPGGDLEPEENPEGGKDEQIIDGETPLGDLPETGVLAAAVDPVMTLGALAVLASLAMLVGAKKKEEKE